MCTKKIFSLDFLVFQWCNNFGRMMQHDGNLIELPKNHSWRDNYNSNKELRKGTRSYKVKETEAFSRYVKLTRSVSCVAKGLSISFLCKYNYINLRSILTWYVMLTLFLQAAAPTLVWPKIFNTIICHRIILWTQMAQETLIWILGHRHQ